MCGKAPGLTLWVSSSHSLTSWTSMSPSGQVSDPEVLLYNFPPGLALAQWLTQTLTAKHLTAETTQDHTSQLCGFGLVI